MYYIYILPQSVSITLSLLSTLHLIIYFKVLPFHQRRIEFPSTQHFLSLLSRLDLSLCPLPFPVIVVTPSFLLYFFFFSHSLFFIFSFFTTCQISLLLTLSRTRVVVASQKVNEFVCVCLFTISSNPVTGTILFAPQQIHF